MSEYYTIVTNKGLEELNNCINSNKPFCAVYMAVGDSNGSYYEPEKTQNELKNEIYRSTLYAKGKKENYIYFDMQLPPSEGNYTIREAGLFDNENNLLAIAKYPETLKIKASDDNISILNIEIQIELSTEAINTIVIDETGNLATIKQVEEYFNSIKTASKTERGIVKIGDNVYMQGGEVTAAPSGPTVTLLKTYKDTNYTVIVQSKNHSYSSMGYGGVPQTGSYFKAYCKDSDRLSSWVTFGFIS